MHSVLFLDDDPHRQVVFQAKVPSATQVWNAKDCIAQLASQDWDEVHLDHDLGEEIYVDSELPNTGMEVCRWIQANHPKIRRIVVHSFNAPAAWRMVSTLKDAGYAVVYIPFGQRRQFEDEV